MNAHRRTTAGRILKFDRQAKKMGAEMAFEYSIENPQRPVFLSSKQLISGWVFSTTDDPIDSVWIVNNRKRTKARYGLDRPDVKNTFPNGQQQSGFEANVTLEDGLLELEAISRSGKKALMYSNEILITTPSSYDWIYNKDLNTRSAEHTSLMQDRMRLYYEEENEGHFQRGVRDPRLMAFYLPQYHPIPENDYAWGKGFTEWRNVTEGKPRFIGHWQPILPGDLGFYDLRQEAVMQSQIEMAKKHGVYGFCFYYYWFSGKKLLTAPLDTLLSHTEWDFNFSICWANENWTKRWDGRDSEVIVQQEYKESDPLQFIKDVEHILLDPRYLREDDKPVLLVYRAADLDGPERYINAWRKYFKTEHNTELKIVAVMGFDDADPRAIGFDAGVDFAPQTTFFKSKLYDDGRYPFKGVANTLLDINFTGSVVPYVKLVNAIGQFTYFDFPTYKSVMPHWDNDARRKGNGFVFAGSTPDLYGRWLEKAIVSERKQEASIIFINAWNEWAEGAVLEPTRQYGYAILNRTTEILSKYSSNKDNIRHNPLFRLGRTEGCNDVLLLHVQYPQLARQLHEVLGHTRFKGDTIITINERFIDDIHDFSKLPGVTIMPTPDRGEDILPFLYSAQRALQLGYANILKLHTPNNEAASESMETEFLATVKCLLEDRSRKTAALSGAASTEICMGWYSRDNLEKWIFDIVPDDFEAKKIGYKDKKVEEIRKFLQNNPR